MNRGFTLIEALMVISILTMMTAFLLLYNRTGERQIILLREKARVISAILRAKNLALGVFIQDVGRETVCGYGAYLNKNRYLIYRDLASDCSSSDNRFSIDNPEELLAGEDFILDSRFQFMGDSDTDILFSPPLPQVFFSGSPALGEKEIKITSPDNDISGSIIINSAGQISE